MIKHPTGIRVEWLRAGVGKLHVMGCLNNKWPTLPGILTVWPFGESWQTPGVESGVNPSSAP